jgi:hypothetical protein
VTTINHPQTACRRCHGEGVVGVVGYSINPRTGIPGPDPQCETEQSCPTCYGTGVRPLDTWEESMGAEMGAFPGQYVIVGDDPEVEQIDFITDNDGWRAPEFVFDAETRDHALPEEIIAVVLPYTDPQAALAQFEAVMFS